MNLVEIFSLVIVFIGLLLLAIWLISKTGRYNAQMALQTSSLRTFATRHSMNFVQTDSYQHPLVGTIPGFPEASGLWKGRNIRVAVDIEDGGATDSGAETFLVISLNLSEAENRTLANWFPTGPSERLARELDPSLKKEIRHARVNLKDSCLLLFPKGDQRGPIAWLSSVHLVTDIDRICRIVDMGIALVDRKQIEE